MLPSVLPHVLCGLVNSGRVKTGAYADLVDTRGLQNSAYEPRLRNCGSRCCKQCCSHNCKCTTQHPLVFHLKLLLSIWRTPGAIVVPTVAQPVVKNLKGDEDCVRQARRPCTVLCRLQDGVTPAASSETPGLFSHASSGSEPTHGISSQRMYARFVSSRCHASTTQVVRESPARSMSSRCHKTFLLSRTGLLTERLCCLDRDRVRILKTICRSVLSREYHYLDDRRFFSTRQSPTAWV